jgi:hypothetical protein
MQTRIPALLAILVAIGATGAFGQNANQTPPKCREVRDARDWLNPYIVVTAKGVAVRVRGSSGYRDMRMIELAPYLKQLPGRAWPCGRIVAAQENGLRSGNDDAAIKEDASRVKGILNELKIEIDWWPS